MHISEGITPQCSSLENEYLLVSFKWGNLCRALVCEGARQYQIVLSKIHQETILGTFVSYLGKISFTLSLKSQTLEICRRLSLIFVFNVLNSTLTK